VRRMELWYKWRWNVMPQIQPTNQVHYFTAYSNERRISETNFAPRLRKRTDPVSETSCFLVLRMADGGQRPGTPSFWGEITFVKQEPFFKRVPRGRKLPFSKWLFCRAKALENALNTVLRGSSVTSSGSGILTSFMSSYLQCGRTSVH
jgi:hypothetical protein